MNLENTGIIIVGLMLMFNTWQNDRLQNKVENLRTSLIHAQASYDANATKHSEFNTADKKISREYNETYNNIDGTPVGGSINFGVRK